VAINRFADLFDIYCVQRELFTRKAQLFHLQQYDKSLKRSTFFKYLQSGEGGTPPTAEFICTAKKALNLDDDEVFALIEARMADEHFKFFSKYIEKCI
jgi:hypothetical protein